MRITEQTERTTKNSVVLLIMLGEEFGCFEIGTKINQIRLDRPDLEDREGVHLHAIVGFNFECNKNWSTSGKWR
jgi:hypothetical protein